MKKNAVVAGTGFEGRDKIIKSHVRDGLMVQLEREPENKYDENAIAVYIAVPKLFGLFGVSRKQIGYIKKTTAKSLAKKMDAGEEVSASVCSFYAPKNKDDPRVTIELCY